MMISIYHVLTMALCTMAMPAETRVLPDQTTEAASMPTEAPASDGSNQTLAQPFHGLQAPPNNVLSLGLPAEGYSDGIHCGAGNGVWAQIEMFKQEIDIFCTTIDDWALTRDGMVSTPMPIDLVNQKDAGKPGTPGYVTFAFVNHGSDRPIVMSYDACQRHLTKIACHKCGGTDCTGSNGLGSKGGVYKQGDMTLSAWLHKGEMPLPDYWS